MKNRRYEGSYFKPIGSIIMKSIRENLMARGGKVLLALLLI